MQKEQLTKEECRSLALAKISEETSDVCILDEHTERFKFGWVFFWQSKRYVETKDPMHMFGGNAPVLVDSFRRNVEFTGTGLPYNFYIDEYINQEYADEISWVLSPNSSPISKGDKVKWIKAIKKVFECNSKEALQKMSFFPQIRTIDRNRFPELIVELGLNGIDVTFERVFE